MFKYGVLVLGVALLGGCVSAQTTLNREPMIAQKYLPAVVKGDKRIILVDGEPVGAINRVPAKDQVRSNLRVGGTAAVGQKLHVRGFLSSWGRGSCDQCPVPAPPASRGGTAAWACARRRISGKVEVAGRPR